MMVEMFYIFLLRKLIELVNKKKKIIIVSIILLVITLAVFTIYVLLFNEYLFEYRSKITIEGGEEIPTIE